jgi:hypothetical protein
MIRGLQITLSGEELSRRIGERIGVTRDRYRGARCPTGTTTRRPGVRCRRGVEARADTHVLAFIRAHIDASKTYQSRDADLAFGELLPQKPGWMEHDEYRGKRASALIWNV